MGMKRKEFIHHLLKQTQGEPGTRGEAFAPANIALCKYWGKRDAELNLPINSSLSISLHSLGTRTTLQFSETSDQIFLNGKPAPQTFATRLSTTLDLFRKEGQFFEVQTENNIATAAGLASSASGFAALMKALNQLMNWGLSLRELSMLARIDSGSASRSLYDGFVVWHRGQRTDGMDSFAEKLPTDWKDLCIGILEVSKARKKVGSTEGMNRTSKTSKLYEAWPKQAQCDYDELLLAISTHDFTRFGKTAENNALAMHATMMAAWPPLCYWKPQSVLWMQKIWKAREEGLEIYFTMDAGPNLKLLFLEKDTIAVRALFPPIQVIHPWGQKA